MPFSPQSSQTVNGSVGQGTGAGAARPWSAQLSDGAAYYTGAKTGQLPTTLGQTTKAACRFGKRSGRDGWYSRV